MLQNSCKGREFWSSRLPESANIVTNVHIYYVAARQAYSATFLAFIEKDGKTAI